MKQVLTILVAALFLGACHCTKCTTAPNRSNTCAQATSCQGNCPKAAAKPAPAPKPVAKVTDDKDLTEVASVTRKADNSAVLSFKEPIKFAHNSDAIDNDSYIQIRKTANILKRYPNTRVRVAGHTDSLGDPDYNVDLSQRRAQAVAMQLVKNGVAAENVSFIGYGAAHPVATNKTPEGRAQNRRVELEINHK